jgi:hypothetical protein
MQGAYDECAKFEDSDAILQIGMVVAGHWVPAIQGGFMLGRYQIE